MNGAQTICPLCQDSVDKLVYRFHYDSEKVIIGKIRTEFPDWTLADGLCQRCLDFFHSEIVMEQRILPAIGPHFPIKTADDFIVIPTGLRINADPRFTGKGVTICFIDSGFYPHADLVATQNRIKKLVDMSDYSAVAAPGEDACWHGTMTSVVCAGDGNLSKGLYKGVASDAELVLIKVQDGRGKIPTKNIVNALNWVLENSDEYNIRIVNISLSGDDVISYKESDIDRLAERLIEKGITVVAAVGNDIEGAIKPPANSLRVIAVGGVDDDNMLDGSVNGLYHSSYGKTIDGLMKPELIAHAIWIAAPILPGTKSQTEARALYQLVETADRDLIDEFSALCHLTELDPKHGDSNDPQLLRQAILKRIRSCKFISADYMHVDGTSFAAPIITGVIAQLLEIKPQLTCSQIRETLFSTAMRISDLPQERQGFGVVRPRNATLKTLTRQAILKPNLSPFVNREQNTIGFYVQHDCASQISVAGSFNQWTSDVLLMEVGNNGIWKLEIPMLPAGRYEYKFFVDEKIWIEDFDNPYREPDGFNGFNSILTVESN